MYINNTFYQPVILFRVDKDSEEEYNIAKKYFPIYKLRSEICEDRSLLDTIVIGRYSVLPYYNELEADLYLRNSICDIKLINSYKEHCWIADVYSWYDLLQEHTPKTWKAEEILNINIEGPFVVKGQTNSRKSQWKTHMFASKENLGQVIANLMEDSLIGQQQIYIREYIPLVTFMYGINDLPITEEYRIFMYGTNVLSSGYYWASYVEDLPIPIRFHGLYSDITDNKDAYKLINNVAVKIKDYWQKDLFFVMDIARTKDGKWILIELNDGQMSGLSCCSPEELYSNMRNFIKVFPHEK